MLRDAQGRKRVRDRGSKVSELREFQDGELIAGTRYRVVRLIGVGGMGSVYEVEHTELGKRFVLKALLRELARREDLAQRLRNEWRALARLQHANIVNVTDAGTSGGGVPFYVMERLDGDTLAAYLKQNRRLHVLEAVAIAVSVLDALSAAHDIGIIHRDVKPANIFLVRGGGVKLLDFGIAKIADASSVVTARGLAVGTPRYMSPEQARGERVDGRSDVYATGLILFEMIAGVGPFDDARDANELLLAHLAREAPPLSSVVLGVSSELEQILSSMLAKDCRARPAHARQVGQQLRDFTARHQHTPTTDALTVEAGYTAETAVPGRPGSTFRPDRTTRPEGLSADPHAGDTGASDAALTRPVWAPPSTTQVTLSVNTHDAFSISPAPNTTSVSPPLFDGSGTLEMTALAAASTRAPASRTSSAPSYPPAERADRTEMLGELTPAAGGDGLATHTRVPLPPVAHSARPTSVTPPPVVNTGQSPAGPAPRAQRLVAVLALAAAGLAALLMAGVLLRHGEPPSFTAAAAAVPPPPEAAPVATAEPQKIAALAHAAPAPSGPPAEGPATPTPTPAPADSAAASAVTHLRTIPDVKRFSVAPESKRALSAAPAGLFLRAIPRQAVIGRPKLKSAGSTLPASGL